MLNTMSKVWEPSRKLQRWDLNPGSLSFRVLYSHFSVYILIMIPCWHKQSQFLTLSSILLLVPSHTDSWLDHLTCIENSKFNTRGKFKKCLCSLVICLVSLATNIKIIPIYHTEILENQRQLAPLELIQVNWQLNADI